MLVGACYTEAEVRRQKDEQVRQKRKREKQIVSKTLDFFFIAFDQFRGIVSQMEKTVQGWESRSCPIIRLESNCWIEFDSL